MLFRSDPVRYQKAIMDAMHAVASSLIPMQQYPGIQTAVEYSLLHLYLCGVVNAIHPGNALKKSIKNYYISELRNIRFQTVQLSYDQNPYVKQKFSKDDLEILKKADASII